MQRKLFLHVGLPKTASSALQAWAGNNRQTLLDHGIHYPMSDLQSAMPKHQDLVSSLFSGDFVGLDRYLSATEAPTLFLSTEGLTNHLYDYPSEHLAAFRKKLVGWDVTALMVRRSIEGWLTSYWKQALLNPKIERFHYATPLQRDTFAQLPRVRRLCDTEKVAQDVATAYGAGEVIIADQGQDWFATIKEVLGLAKTVEAPDRVHISVSDDLAEVVRQINEMPLRAEARAAFLGLLQHSRPTHHSILLRHAVEHPPEKLAKGFEPLSDLLSALKPENSGQQSIVQEMKEKLLLFYVSNRD